MKKVVGSFLVSMLLLADVQAARSAFTYAETEALLSGTITNIIIGSSNITATAGDADITDALDAQYGIGTVTNVIVDGFTGTVSSLMVDLSDHFGTAATNDAADFARVITNDYKVVTPAGGYLRTINPSDDVTKIRCQPIAAINNSVLVTNSLYSGVESSGQYRYQHPMLYPTAGTYARILYDIPMENPDGIYMLFGPNTNSVGATYGGKFSAYIHGWNSGATDFGAASVQAHTNFTFTTAEPQSLYFDTTAGAQLLGKELFIQALRDPAYWSSSPEIMILGVWAVKTNTTPDVLSTFLIDAGATIQ